MKSLLLFAVFAFAAQAVDTDKYSCLETCLRTQHSTPARCVLNCRLGLGDPASCTPVPGQYFCYIVQEGDDLYDIAQTFNVPLKTLCSFNKDILHGDCSALDIGMQLKIPNKSICKKPCQNGGYCIKNDKCMCSGLWSGVDCTSRIAPNATIYLTFDDGPKGQWMQNGSQGGTNPILDQLKSNGVVGSFMICGYNFDKTSVWPHDDQDTSLNVKWNIETLQRAMKEGHSIGTHSYSHMWNATLWACAYTDLDLDMADFQKNEDTIKNSLGGSLPPTFSKLGRLPCTNTWRTSSQTVDDDSMGPVAAKVADALHQKGINLLGWDLEWEHTMDDSGIGHPVQDVALLSNQIDKVVLDNKKSKRKGKVVLLMHDVMFATDEDAAKLGDLIKTLKAHGYKFGLADHYDQ